MPSNRPPARHWSAASPRLGPLPMPDWRTIDGAERRYRVVGHGRRLIGVALVARQLETLLLAVTVTIIVSLPLSEAASWAQRRGAPRALGALGALVMGLGATIGLGLAVLPTFVEPGQAVRRPSAQHPRPCRPLPARSGHELACPLSPAGRSRSGVRVPSHPARRSRRADRDHRRAASLSRSS